MATKALQIDALWSGIFNPSTGKAYAGALVRTFEAGTSNLKAVWEDRDKTLPTVAGKSAFALDSNGQAQVFGDGVYKISIYAPTDTGYTNPLITIDGAEYEINDVAFSDADFVVFNDADNTKELDFDLSEITTSTRRTVTWPDADVDFTAQKLFSDLDTDGNQIQWSKGSDIASANALTLGTDGNYFDITGTTTINTISTSARIGTTVIFQFDGILTLTHSADLFLCNNGEDITTAAGDHAMFTEYASGDWRCVAYQRADGTALRDVITNGTVQATTSGDAFDFTGIPAWVTRVTVLFSDVSTDGTNDFIVQLGDAGGFETTGYTGTYESNGSRFSYTGSGFQFDNLAAAAQHSGRMVIDLIDAATNTWVADCSIGRTDSAGFIKSTGDKSLSGTLTQIRFAKVADTDDFDNGKVNIKYE